MIYGRWMFWSCVNEFENMTQYLEAKTSCVDMINAKLQPFVIVLVGTQCERKPATIVEMFRSNTISAVLQMC